MNDEKQKLLEALKANRLELAKLKEGRANLMRKGKYIQASAATVGVKQLEDAIAEQEKALEEYHKKYTINAIYNHLPTEKAQLLHQRLIVANISLDMLDTCVRDIDEIMEEISGGLHLEIFDKISEMGNEVKQVMESSHREDIEHKWLWSELMDSIEDYLYMRARAYNKKEDALNKKLESKQTIKQQQS